MSLSNLTIEYSMALRIGSLGNWITAYWCSIHSWRSLSAQLGDPADWTSLLHLSIDVRGYVSLPHTLCQTTPELHAITVHSKFWPQRIFDTHVPDSPVALCPVYFRTPHTRLNHRFEGNPGNLPVFFEELHVILTGRRQRVQKDRAAQTDGSY